MPVVTVLYFAVLREQRGCERERVEFQPGDTVGSLYEALFPLVGGERLPVGFARNRDHVRSDEPLVDGDEVAFLPPLGGG